MKLTMRSIPRSDDAADGDCGDADDGYDYDDDCDDDLLDNYYCCYCNCYCPPPHQCHSFRRPLRNDSMMLSCR